MTDLSFIVKMVIYKCRELENPVTETLAAYVAQTTLNPGMFDLLSFNTLFKSQNLTLNYLNSVKKLRDVFTWKVKYRKMTPKIWCNSPFKDSKKLTNPHSVSQPASQAPSSLLLYISMNYLTPPDVL